MTKYAFFAFASAAMCGLYANFSAFYAVEGKMTLCVMNIVTAVLWFASMIVWISNMCIASTNRSLQKWIDELRKGTP